MSLDLYSSFIAKSRYCRFIPELGRRESWEETVARYFNFMEKHLQKHHNYTLTNELRSELESAVINLEIMPSMRSLMTAGEALERSNIAGYNCAFTTVDDPKAFDEAMMILLCGTGVGFSVERQDVAKLPEIPETLFPSNTVVVVSDSKEGWAKALRQVIALLYAGEMPKWDVSKVRPAGARLKTFGGRASGAEPLVELFKFVTAKFKNAAGRKLNSIECHDIMCKIGEVVVVGGVRRSAMISLSNLSDERMRVAKAGAWWEQTGYRALANNSVCYTEKPEMGAFMHEWNALYESKSGERGIFNREASEKKVASIGRRETGHAWGTNPCCFTGDMNLLTSHGNVQFKELAGKSVSIISSDGSVTNGSVWCSGEKDVVELKFRQKRNSIKCTPDHVFQLSDGTECRADQLKGKRVKVFFKMKTTFDRESFFAGFIQGDGATSRLASDTHKALEVYIGNKDGDVGALLGFPVGSIYSTEALNIATKYGLSPETLPTRDIPSVISGDFLSGLYSANGSVVKDYRVAFKTTCRTLADSLIAKLKESYGITATMTTNKEKLNNFPNGEYLCKESYDVNISKYSDIVKFTENISFIQKYKQDALVKLLQIKAPMVSCVKPAGKEEVFDFTEPKNHWGVVEGVVAHNSEIILRPQQFCNLSECIVRENDTEESLTRKIELCTILGTFQATLTKFPYLRKVWVTNTEQERLLGVSMTGIMDSKLTSINSVELEGLLQRLRAASVEVNKKMAEAIGIPQSAAITCVKPSGTVSQLVDSASGIHHRHSPYYIRRVRGDVKDPLTQYMISKGVQYEPCVMKPDTTVVFSFPKKSPEGSTTRNDVTAMEHLELWLTYQRHFCEHKPSITVSVKEDEWMEVGAFVWKHFDELSGVSFLPMDGGSYRQAPYEEISKEEYEVMFENSIKHIDWSDMKENEDSTTGSQELACSGGSGCEII